MTSERIQFSVIIAVHDQSRQLESNLPKFFSSQSDIDYEVIVVNDSSTDDTPDVLTRMKCEFSNLYTTFLPISDVPIPSRLRLALTIGVKAAHGKWIVLADISRPPINENWLMSLSANLDSSAEVILGYDNKTNVVQSFDSLEEASPFLCKAERKSGHGHNGRFFQFQRGHYNIMMVKKECVHDALKLFDQTISLGQLAGLRLKVLFNNLFI